MGGIHKDKNHYFGLVLGICYRQHFLPSNNSSPSRRNLDSKVIFFPQYMDAIEFHIWYSSVYSLNRVNAKKLIYINKRSFHI